MSLKIKYIFVIFILSVFFVGCSQKVTIKALQPAEIGQMALKKKIAITPFKNDTVGLSGIIEAKLASYKVDGKNFFTVVSRKDLNKVINEQKLQSSELFDETTSARIGKMIGAQALISGEVADASANSSYYLQDKQRCIQYYKDGGCARWRFYKVKCNVVKANVSANINVIDIQTGSIIYADTMSRQYNDDSCKINPLLYYYDTKKILSKNQALTKLTNEIANSFVYKLTPHYIYISVNLLDSLDIDNATSMQKEKFEASLEYIKSSRFDKAKRFLGELMDEFNEQSYVVAYDLGVTYEATGDYNEAKKLYQIADNLTIKPVDEINQAIKRIDILIQKRDEAIKQMEIK
jgi:curli biogenesis system outer membrane secretion channel CsgG